MKADAPERDVFASEDEYMRELFPGGPAWAREQVASEIRALRSELAALKSGTRIEGWAESFTINGCVAWTLMTGDMIPDERMRRAVLLLPGESSEPAEGGETE